MGKEKYLSFTQKSLADESSRADVSGGVCLGYAIEFIKYFKKYGSSDSIAKGFGLTEGSGLTESLLDMGEKGIAKQYEGDLGDSSNLFGKKRELELMGFTVTVGKDTGADKTKTVNEIKSSGRFAFHILYFDVYKDSSSKAGWHVIVLKGNGWEGVGFNRIFYAMDPNLGLWRISGTDSLGTWLWSDIKAFYNPFNMIVYTITE
jgi:hypothetical protein